MCILEIIRRSKIIRHCFTYSLHKNINYRDCYKTKNYIDVSELNTINWFKLNISATVQTIRHELIQWRGLFFALYLLFLNTAI
jgi:hypothetical protein